MYIYIHSCISIYYVLVCMFLVRSWNIFLNILVANSLNIKKINIKIIILFAYTPNISTFSNSDQENDLEQKTLNYCRQDMANKNSNQK